MDLKGMWVTVKAGDQEDGNRVAPNALYFNIGDEEHEVLFDEAADQYDNDDADDLKDYYVDGPNYDDADGAEMLEERVREVTSLGEVVAEFEDEDADPADFSVEGLQIEFYVDDEPAPEDLAETPVFTVEYDDEIEPKVIFTAKPEAVKGMELAGE